MRTVVVLTTALLTLASTAFAEISSSESKRLMEASSVVQELRMASNGIPDDTWNHAQCVAVIPGLKKAAFIVGGEFGKGVMSCRNGQAWSAPVFIQLEKGSAGFQIGAEEVDVVLLMMNRRGVEKLLNNKVDLGGDVSIAAGPVGRTASAATDANLTAEMLSYSRTKGVFAGINLSGGVLKPDRSADTAAYGSSVSSRDVLFSGNVTPPPAAQAFMRSLHQGDRA